MLWWVQYAIYKKTIHAEHLWNVSKINVTCVIVMIIDGVHIFEIDIFSAHTLAMLIIFV